MGFDDADRILADPADRDPADVDEAVKLATTGTLFQIGVVPPAMPRAEAATARRLPTRPRSPIEMLLEAQRRNRGDLDRLNDDQVAFVEGSLRWYLEERLSVSSDSIERRAAAIPATPTVKYHLRHAPALVLWNVLTASSQPSERVVQRLFLKAVGESLSFRAAPASGLGRPAWSTKRLGELVLETALDGLPEALEALEGDLERQVDPELMLLAREAVRVTLERRSNCLRASSLPPNVAIVHVLRLPGAAGDALHFCGGPGGLNLLTDGTNAYSEAANENTTLNESWKRLQAVETLVLSKDLLALEPLENFRKALPNTFLLEERDARTLANVKFLSAAPRRDPDRVISLLTPRTRQEMSRVGLAGIWSPELMREVAAVADGLIRQWGIEDIHKRWWDAGGVLGRPDMKGQLIDALQTHREVIIVVAHGDSAGVWLPTGERLNSDEARSLDLSHHPLVFLISCYGTVGVEGIAVGLRDAGARAVFGFDTSLDAIEGLDLAGRLLRALDDESSSYLSALRDLFIAVDDLKQVRMRVVVD